jgi:hypothetical protein
MTRMNQGIAAQMSARAALVSIVLTALVSFSSILPEGPDKVRWTGLFWLSVYASVMLAQGAWFGWRWLSSRRQTS